MVGLPTTSVEIPGNFVYTKIKKKGFFFYRVIEGSFPNSRLGRNAKFLSGQLCTFHFLGH
jgi:hypothetical protein